MPCRCREGSYQRWVFSSSRRPQRKIVWHGGAPKLAWLMRNIDSWREAGRPNPSSHSFNEDRPDGHASSNPLPEQKEGSMRYRLVTLRCLSPHGAVRMISTPELKRKNHNCQQQRYRIDIGSWPKRIEHRPRSGSRMQDPISSKKIAPLTPEVLIPYNQDRARQIGTPERGRQQSRFYLRLLPGLLDWKI